MCLRHATAKSQTEEEVVDMTMLFEDTPEERPEVPRGSY